MRSVLWILCGILATSMAGGLYWWSDRPSDGDAMPVWKQAVLDGNYVRLSENVSTSQRIERPTTETNYTADEFRVPPRPTNLPSFPPPDMRQGTLR